MAGMRLGGVVFPSRVPVSSCAKASTWGSSRLPDPKRRDELVRSQTSSMGETGLCTGEVVDVRLGWSLCLQQEFAPKLTHASLNLHLQQRPFLDADARRCPCRCTQSCASETVWSIQTSFTAGQERPRLHEYLFFLSVIVELYTIARVASCSPRLDSQSITWTLHTRYYKSAPREPLCTQAGVELETARSRQTPERLVQPTRVYSRRRHCPWTPQESGAGKSVCLAEYRWSHQTSLVVPTFSKRRDTL